MKIRIKAMGLVVAVTIVLAACGGGGTASDNGLAIAPNASTSETAITTVFAEPSGVLCANMIGTDCVEPTSSGATLLQLLTTLSNAQGPTVRMTRFGSSSISHTKTAGGILTEGSASYSSLEKPIVFGRNQIKLDSKTYAFESILPNGNLNFRASTSDTLLIPPLSSLGVTFSQIDTVSGGSGVGTPNLAVTVDSNSWLSFFGVLTDKTDVAIPADHLIHYSGGISFWGGDGTPFSASMFGRNVSVLCPINMTLDTTNGKLAASTANCTDARNRSLQFTLRDLFIKNSRVWGNLGDEASAFTTGPAYPFDPAATVVPTVSVTFTSSQVGGAVYATNAQFISIQGSSTLGQFAVSVVRQ